jgi:D-alanyl-D-alanine dipeptidase
MDTKIEGESRESSLYHLYERPISPLKKQDWTAIRRMTTEECGEPLVPMNTMPEVLINHPEYYIQGLKGSLPVCYARLSVFKKILKAAELLPKGYKFVVLDAWRPIEVQQFLYDQFKSIVRERHPEIKDEDKITEMTTQFVGLPSLDYNKPGGHNAGGAVDLTIADENGIWLDMGTCFDETTDRTVTRYYEEKLESGDHLSEREIGICKNRRLLYHIMIKVGFTNYTEEWWHYDFGDQLWAYHNDGKVKAIYSRVTPTFAWHKISE